MLEFLHAIQDTDQAIQRQRVILLGRPGGPIGHVAMLTMVAALGGDVPLDGHWQVCHSTRLRFMCTLSDQA